MRQLSRGPLKATKLSIYVCVQSHSHCPTDVEKYERQVLMNLTVSDFEIDLCHSISLGVPAGAHTSLPSLDHRSFAVHFGLDSSASLDCSYLLWAEVSLAHDVITDIAVKIDKRSAINFEELKCSVMAEHYRPLRLQKSRDAPNSSSRTEDSEPFQGFTVAR